MILYKYLSTERIDVLRNNSIRFTQPGDLNDPFEFEPYIYETVSNDNINKIVMSKLHQDYITHNAWAKNMPLDFFILMNYKNYKEMVLNMWGLSEPLALKRMTFFIKHFFLVLSLSREYDHELMWSHYAENGKGFAIGFDATHKFFTNQDKDELNNTRTIEKGDVEYSDDRPNVTLEALEASHLFFTKSRRWEHEKEYRYIKAIEPDVNEAEDYYPVKLFEFPVSCVKEIYFGARVSSIFIDHVLELLRDNGYQVNVYKMSASRTEFKLKREVLD
ncbi:DUF2971 domain-containing protein [Vreelandella sp. EE27]